MELLWAENLKREQFLYHIILTLQGTKNPNWCKNISFNKCRFILHVMNQADK